MPRPRICRRISTRPVHGFYKPQGISLQDLKGVILPLEGLEALRVSRPTFSRILAEARRQVARALSSGWAIRIEGGDYKIVEPETLPRGKGRRRGCDGGFRCMERTEVKAVGGHIIELETSGKR